MGIKNAEFRNDESCSFLDRSRISDPLPGHTDPDPGFEIIFGSGSGSKELIFFQNVVFFT